AGGALGSKGSVDSLGSVATGAVRAAGATGTGVLRGGSATAARACCVTGGTVAAGDGRVFAEGAGLGVSTAFARAAGVDGFDKFSVAGADGASETSASDCSTPPVATFAAGA